jgi:PBP1b-binding outer membrane lipoprotein LpoB
MKKLMIVSLVAAAGLTLAACNKAEAPADANATEMNEAAAVEGAATDAMTNVDAAADSMAADANAIAADANAIAADVNAAAPAEAAK